MGEEPGPLPGSCALFFKRHAIELHDLTEAEGLADLLTAEPELQRRSAMARAGGAFRRRLDDWRERLLTMSARAEVAIDYADEEEGAAPADLSEELGGLAAELTLIVAGPRVEPLRDGIRVVLAGPPNSGKSSLLNALAQGEKAIVTHIPGTTRDVIEVPVAIGGVPFVLVDTAGLRDSEDVVEAIGIDRARSESERADLLLWLGEADAAPQHEGLILVAAKADMDPARPGLPTSALTGKGIAELAEVLVVRARSMLPKGDELALDRRQHHLLAQARDALVRASEVREPVLVAEELRLARLAIDRIAGRTGVEDLLDSLFRRFCLGK